jgi:hypothetical protein
VGGYDGWLNGCSIVLEGGGTSMVAILGSEKWAKVVGCSIRVGKYSWNYILLSAKTV